MLNDIPTSRREENLLHRIRELSTLYEVNKILTSTLDMDRALELIVKTTAKKMRVKACGLRLFDKNTGEMVFKTAHGLSQDYINKGSVFVWKGLYKEVIMEGKVAVVTDVAKDKRFEYTKKAVQEGIKSMLSVALQIRNEPIGALSVYTDRYYLFSRDQIRIFKGIANEAASVIEKAMLYEERMENQRIEQELSAAAKIQANLMPQETPQLPLCKIAARNVPSRTIGGDFYDFIIFDQQHLGLVIADVAGKGIPGAILMASTRASLRAYVEDPHKVSEVITRLNNVMCRDTRPEQFVSLFYGILDIPERVFTYVNAGHNPPILLRDKQETNLDKGGPILGVLPDATYMEESIQLLTQDIIIFYTDGITEAERDDEQFGTERLKECVIKNATKAANKIVENILNEVSEFNVNSPQVDDRTIIILKEIP
ncbi:SpoIIE family protein phosphatase [Candidatus Poribacteria bacterium]|nr:SpoIIE family protein phosphatase [Candidatus Poribacteria bacterium]